MANTSFWDAPNRTTPDYQDRIGIQRNQTNAGEHITLRQVTNFVYADAETAFTTETNMDNTEVFFIRKASENKKVTAPNLFKRYDYSTSETNTFKKWIDNKTIYRKVVDCGALPNNTSKNVAHGISNLDRVVSANFIARNDSNVHTPVNSYQNNFASTYFLINNTNVVVNAIGNYSTYTSSYCVLEYTKTS